ncbi:hypothetical protein N7540_003883 [Penicillium herquei]|nr:hypothetical protein N7540_003883 [Penicillium herquei]
MLQKLIDEHKKDPEHRPGPEFAFGTRLNYALFVDDICLESLVHMDMPVVKVLSKQWGNLSLDERKYTIHPEWHDGVTEIDEEDVGWMYINILDYVDVYDKLEMSHALGGWYTIYLRPPGMMDHSKNERSQASGENKHNLQCSTEHQLT